MARSLVVVGAGGFGRELLDVVDAVNEAAATPVWRVVGVVDDAPSADNLRKLERRGIGCLGGSGDPLGWDEPTSYVVGIGSPRVRRRIAAAYDEAGFSAATLVHPAATIGFDVEVGEGTVICAGARVTTHIRLGRHVHLNPNVTIGHDTTLHDFVSVNPQGAVSGDCVIGEAALIGVSAVVLNQLTVGREAVVGGAACVVRDVPDGAVVKGVPAR